MFIVARGDFEDVIRKIAKIMINIMAHKKIFPEVWGDFAEVSAGYPYIKVDKETYYFRAAEGHVYLPAGLNHAAIFNIKLEIRNEMEKLIDEIGGYEKLGLGKYHTVITGEFTHLKIESAQSNISCDVSEKNTHYLIQFEQTDEIVGVKKVSGRFVWYFESINRFNFEFAIMNARKLLSAHVCSIFYDGADILKLPDMTFLDEFHLSECKHTMCVLPDNITISKKYHIFALELNNYWREMNIDTANIPELGILCRQIDHEIIRDKLQKNVCCVCEQELYGKVYAVSPRDINYHYTKGKPIDKYKLICPLCAHMNVKFCRSAYKLLHVTELPTTPRDIIDKMEISDAKKRAMHTIMQKDNIQIKCMKMGSSQVNYLDIDDKYICVDNLALCAFLPAAKGKKIFNLIIR